jgi:hypothetical protein
MTRLSCQGTPDISPLERFGHGLVERVNKGQHTLAELLHGCAIGPFEEAPHQEAAPDFHLIEPGRVCRRVHPSTPMLWIVSEARSMCHGRDESGFPVDASIHCNPTRLGHQADSGGGLRRVQASHDTHPVRFRIECDGALHGGDAIFCRAGGPDGRRHHVPGCPLNVRDHRLGAMTTVFTCASFYASWRHGAGRLGPFNRLTTGLLIRADEVHPLRSSWWRVWRPRTDGLDSLVKVLRVRCPCMIEPVT